MTDAEYLNVLDALQRGPGGDYFVDRAQWDPDGLREEVEREVWPRVVRERHRLRWTCREGARLGLPKEVIVRALRGPEGDLESWFHRAWKGEP